jgi:hypothetical protein
VLQAAPPAVQLASCRGVPGPPQGNRSVMPGLSMSPLDSASDANYFKPSQSSAGSLESHDIVRHLLRVRDSSFGGLISYPTVSVFCLPGRTGEGRRAGGGAAAARRVPGGRQGEGRVLQAAAPLRTASSRNTQCRLATSLGLLRVLAIHNDHRLRSDFHMPSKTWEVLQVLAAQ